MGRTSYVIYYSVSRNDPSEIVLRQLCNSAREKIIAVGNEWAYAGEHIIHGGDSTANFFYSTRGKGQAVLSEDISSRQIILVSNTERRLKSLVDSLGLPFDKSRTFSLGLNGLQKQRLVGS